MLSPPHYLKLIGLQREGNSKLTASFPMKMLRKISRLVSREDGARPLFIPSASSGTHNVEPKFYNHQMKLFLGSECKDGAGKSEKTYYKQWLSLPV